MQPRRCLSRKLSIDRPLSSTDATGGAGPFTACRRRCSHPVLASGLHVTCLPDTDDLDIASATVDAVAAFLEQAP